MKRTKEMEEYKKTHHVFPKVELDLPDFEHDGLILDIGGGGEGVIGKLKGQEVIAIDIKEEELLEAVDGPLKIIMDARELKFLDGSFSTVTAFFVFMYIKEKEDQFKVLQEISRVTKPGGILHIWDIDHSQIPDTDKRGYILPLLYRVKDEEKETGYGMIWPDVPRGLDYYLDLAGQVGFSKMDVERNQNTFYCRLRKD
jgi:ubiquinone/menaquinone biosynthesis C-methylase UbiE